MTTNPILEPLRRSTAVRLLVLFMAFCVGLMIAGAAAAAIPHIDGLSERTALLASSTVQCVVAFCLPAWIAAKWASPTPRRFLGLEQRCEPRAYAGVVIVYILALPAMNQIIAWNADLHFPQWAAGIEKTLRSWEETNGAVAAKILDTKTFGQMLATVSVVGLLTGFSEEVLFRGALQRIFAKSGISATAAVWIAAFIFSAIHFQFFGFVPRLLMGAFFGFTFIWTGSLWPAVLAHAINNSAVVIFTWAHGGLDTNALDQVGVADNGSIPWAAILSALATTIFFMQYRHEIFRKPQNS